jgi:hypothetical protein
MRKLAAGAASLLLAFGSSAALAGATSSATLNGFTVTLYDLNPGDGVAPSIAFTLAQGLYGSYVRTSATDRAIGSQADNAWSLQPFGPAQADSAVGLAQSSAAISGSLANGLRLSAQGSAGGTLTPGFGSDYAASAATASSEYSYNSLSFLLSPNTLAVFGGTYDLFAQTTVGLVSVQQPPYTQYSESANASVTVTVNGVGPSGSGTQNNSQNQSLNAGYTTSYNPQTGQWVYTGQTFSLLDAQLAASFTNASDAAITGFLTLSLGVSGYSSVLTAVPEPSTYLLMLAGVAVLIARRRRA